MRREGKSKPKRLTMEETRQRRMLAKQERAEKDRVRLQSVRAAKRLARQEVSGESIKALLGGELWFEEKMRRTKRGEVLIGEFAIHDRLWLRHNAATVPPQMTMCSRGLSARSGAGPR